MNDQNKHIVPYEIIIKSLSGELSPDDKRALEIWLSAGIRNQSIFDELEKQWHSFDQIQDIARIDIEKEWKIQSDRISKVTNPDYNTTAKSTRFWTLSKAAAIFIIFSIAAIVIYYAAPFINVNETIVTTSIESIELPDGSIVTLNAKSTFKYPYEFKKGNRTVKLSGEAFFEIVPDAASPFIIKTEYAMVRVLGTSFNVETKNEQTRVVVKSGKVSLSDKSNTDAVVILEKGEYGIHNRNDNLLTKNFNENVNYLSWKTRKIDFNNENLNDAIEVLESVYNCKIIIDDPKFNNCKITSSFDNQTLEAVLNVIKSTLDLDIKLQEDTFVIEGNGC